MLAVPVSNKVGPDHDTVGCRAALRDKLNVLPNWAELGAPELGKLTELFPLQGTIVVNCANKEGVNPKITQGLQLVTVCVPCGPFTVEIRCPFAATT